MINPAAIAGAVVVIAALLFGSSTQAHPLDRQECTEGSDFIKNAALSRDNGMDGMTFLTRTIDDLELIKVFPPELRWFVQDPQDEEYLLKAVAEVFDNPQDPLVHQRNFLDACLIRTSLNF
jgi:hypothetical protein